MVLKSIDYRRGEDGTLSLRILDQLQLPHNMSAYFDLCNSSDAHRAIKQMQVRGAPAIALVAILSLAIEIQSLDLESAKLIEYIKDKLDYLVTSRPTAVNLADAAYKLRDVITRSSEGADIKKVYTQAAEQMLADDVQDNLNIGRHGADHILKEYSDKKVAVLTICNTGSLATAGYGTAYSVIIQLAKRSRLQHAYFCETRPYNQGARLTSAELLYDEIPSTMVLDSSVAALFSGAKHDQDPSRFGAILVGADRVARNGDTANKIGTCQLAVLAKHFGIPFFVCAPWTTIDLKTDSGDDIVIEERAQKEVRQVWGASYDPAGHIKKSPSGDIQREFVEICSEDVNIWNPAFDVTPHELISGIVTETGVLTRDSSGSFQLEQMRAAMLANTERGR